MSLGAYICLFILFSGAQEGDSIIVDPRMLTLNETLNYNIVLEPMRATLISEPGNTVSL